MASTPLRVLVTGANGFLGRNIIKAFQTHPAVRLIAACRQPDKLMTGFNGEIRSGDLRDPRYRNALVKDIDVICHAGTWAAMWNHERQEQANFLQPAYQLIEAALSAGVKRFIMASTVAIADRASAHPCLDDFSETKKTGFWPHLDYLIELDNYMKANAHRGMQMATMRLGHFVGAGNSLGLVPVLLPRLKSYLVPWLSKGKSRLPLIADSDLGNSFVQASLARLNDYESFNICGTSFPTTREVIEYIAAQTRLPTPRFSVPYPLGYAFAWLMEKLFPVLPGKAPFLTRSVVHLAEEWVCQTDYAHSKLGFLAEKDWRTAMDEALSDLQSRGYPWPYMAQIEPHQIR